MGLHINDKSREPFEIQLQRVVECKARHGKLPEWRAAVAEGKATSTASGLFFTWLRNRRRDLNRGALAPERVAFLDERLPGWRSDFKAPAVRGLPEHHDDRC